MFDIFSEKNRILIKKVFLPSVVILLCFVSVVGSTYALFTNGEDGKVNINAASGYIQLDILDTNNQSLIGDNIDFIIPSDLDLTNLEPGATIRTQGFKIKNNGNITVNFKLFKNENSNINWTELEEGFELWITDDKNDKTNAQNVKNFIGTLAPGETSGEYYLFIKMKESAGNNFQSQIFTGIGITVYAVQGNVSTNQ